MKIIVTSNNPGGSGSSGTVFQEYAGGAGTITGAVDGANATYVLSHTPLTTAGLEVFLDGILQRPTIEYSLAIATITFVTPPAVGSQLDVYYNY